MAPWPFGAEIDGERGGVANSNIVSNSGYSDIYNGTQAQDSWKDVQQTWKKTMLKSFPRIFSSKRIYVFEYAASAKQSPEQRRPWARAQVGRVLEIIQIDCLLRRNHSTTTPQSSVLFLGPGHARHAYRPHIYLRCKKECS